jgi:hypothetical protein
MQLYVIGTPSRLPQPRAQNTAEAYAHSSFLPLAGGTMSGTLK